MHRKLTHISWQDGPGKDAAEEDWQFSYCLLLVCLQDIDTSATLTFSSFWSPPQGTGLALDDVYRRAARHMRRFFFGCTKYGGGTSASDVGAPITAGTSMTREKAWVICTRSAAFNAAKAALKHDVGFGQTPTALITTATCTWSR